jgi:hypothetical protein
VAALADHYTDDIRSFTADRHEIDQDGGAVPGLCAGAAGVALALLAGGVALGRGTRG